MTTDRQDSRTSRVIKRATTALIMLVGARAMTAQEVIVNQPAPLNSVYLELAGAGGFSANYELLILARTSVRGGVAYWDWTDIDNTRQQVNAVIVGSMWRMDVSDLIGKGPGRFVEAGATLTAGNYLEASYGTTTHDGSFAVLTPTIGLRFEPPHGGFMFRVTFTPHLALSGEAMRFRERGTTWAGLSAGWAF